MAEVDDLTSALAGGIAVSDEMPHHRMDDFKGKPKGASSQRKRRRDMLEKQKTRRRDQVNLMRTLAEEIDENEVENDKEPKNEDEKMDESEDKPRKRRYKDQIMYSECLEEIPEDFQENWDFVLCPVGRRCLVISSKGSTTAFARNGRRLFTFPSNLPGGNRHIRGRGTSYCILDCIYDSLRKTFYVLDIMCWRGHPVYDSDAEFRSYWLQTKITEEEGLDEHSKINPYVFVSLPRIPCTPELICSAMGTPQQFDVDGILFFQKQGLYIPGIASPLVLWLKSDQASAALGFPVPLPTVAEDAQMLFQVPVLPNGDVVMQPSRLQQAFN